MSAIRVIFDGKTFVPQQAVTLPIQSEAIVLVEDQESNKRLDADIRAYYEAGADEEDDAWGRESKPDVRAWDEE